MADEIRVTLAMLTAQAHAGMGAAGDMAASRFLKIMNKRTVSSDPPASAPAPGLSAPDSATADAVGAVEANDDAVPTPALEAAYPRRAAPRLLASYFSLPRPWLPCTAAVAAEGAACGDDTPGTAPPVRLVTGYRVGGRSATRGGREGGDVAAGAHNLGESASGVGHGASDADRSTAWTKLSDREGLSRVPLTRRQAEELLHVRRPARRASAEVPERVPERASATGGLAVGAMSPIVPRGRGRGAGRGRGRGGASSSSALPGLTTAPSERGKARAVGWM